MPAAARPIIHPRKRQETLNYLGPTGNQRDEITVIRRRSQDVEY